MKYADYKKEDYLLLKEYEERSGYNDPFSIETEMTTEEKEEFLREYDTSFEVKKDSFARIRKAIDDNVIKKTNWNNLNKASVKSWLNKNNHCGLYIQDEYGDWRLVLNVCNQVYVLPQFFPDTDNLFHRVLDDFARKEKRAYENDQQMKFEEEHKETIRAGELLREIDNGLRVRVPIGTEYDAYGRREIKNYEVNSLCSVWNRDNPIYLFNKHNEVMNTSHELLTVNQVKELQKLMIEYGKKVKELSERFEAKAKAIVDGTDW